MNCTALMTHAKGADFAFHLSTSEITPSPLCAATKPGRSCDNNRRPAILELGHGNRRSIAAPCSQDSTVPNLQNVRRFGTRSRCLQRRCRSLEWAYEALRETHQVFPRACKGINRDPEDADMSPH